MNMNRSLLCVFLYFLLPQRLLYAQENKIDSLMAILNNTNHDSITVQTLNELSKQWQKKNDYDSALFFARNALALSKKNDFKKGAAIAYENIGICKKEKGDYPEALKNHSAAVKLKEEIGDKKGIATSLGSIGVINNTIGNYTESLKNHFEALKISHELGDKKAASICYNNIANVYFLQGNYPQAIEYHLSSLRVKEEIGDKKGIATSLLNIGIVYQDQGKYSEALTNYLASLKSAEAIGNNALIANLYNNIGIVNEKTGSNTEALNYYLKASKLFEELGQKKGLANSRDNVGIIYAKQQNMVEALKFHLSTLKIREEMGDQYGEAMTCNNIGSDYLLDCNFRLAIVYLNRSLDISKKIAAKNLIKENYLTLSWAYELINDDRKALAYYKNYTEIKDSMLNDDNNKHIAQMNARYESEKKDKEITQLNSENEIKALKVKHQESQLITYTLEALQKQNEISLLNKNNEIKTLQLTEVQRDLIQRDLQAKAKANELELSKKDKELQTQELQKQKIIKNSFIAAAILILLLGILIVNRIQLRKKLEQQQAVIEERRRISTDMHDDLGSNLSKITLMSEVLKRNVHNKKEKDDLENISSSAQSALEKMSEIVWTLNPKNDKLVNLLAYIRKYAVEYFEPTDIECKINIPTETADVELSGEQRRNIFLTVKESLHNVVKHSGAAKVNITFTDERGVRDLVIHDNGKGIDTNSIGKRRDGTFGNGLENMKQRMEKINGKFEVENNNGTLIRLVISST